jgi:hypothetical protein
MKNMTGSLTSQMNVNQVKTEANQEEIIAKCKSIKKK